MRRVRSRGWRCTTHSERRRIVVVDVTPNGDVKPHAIGAFAGAFCWCEPARGVEDGLLLVLHHAADGRGWPRFVEASA